MLSCNRVGGGPHSVGAREKTSAPPTSLPLALPHDLLRS